MILRKVALGLLATVFLGPIVAYASEPAALKYNPFSRPSSTKSVDVRPESRSVAAVESLELRATLVSEKYQLANIAGQIVRPGEIVGGHVLSKVYEDRAEFTREGKRVVVYVKPELVSKDE